MATNFGSAMAHNDDMETVKASETWNRMVIEKLKPQKSEDGKWVAGPTYMSLGRAAMKQNKTKEAEGYLKLAMAHQSTGGAQALLGILFTKEHRHWDSLPYHREGLHLSIFPIATAKEDLFQSLWMTGQYKEAIDHLHAYNLTSPLSDDIKAITEHRVQDLTPEDAKIAQEAAIAVSKKDYATAIGSFDSLVLRNPANFLIKRDLTDALVKSGNADRSIRLARDVYSVCQSQNTRSVLLRVINLCLSRQTDRQRCVELGKEMSNVRPFVELYVVLTEACRVTGATEDAVKYYKAAYQMDPSHAAVQGVLGHLSRVAPELARQIQAAIQHSP